MKLKVDLFSRWLLTLVGLAIGSFAMAQGTVSGTITDGATKEPLIGANILVVGTSTGTVTDVDGSYSLNVPAGATQLEISYTGYTAQTVDIAGRRVIDVALAAGQVLDEVVVVGYGSVRKGDATGAVVAIGEDDFNKGVIASPEQLLQGRAAGVQITASSGEPGAGVNIRIRGTSSVRSNNNPLFVVDGVPLDGRDDSAGGSDFGAGTSSARNPLNFINPDDIESISVLKDASAAAIYGSRGANGVVLITTKRGKSGTGNLTLSAQTSVSTILNKIDVLGAGEYVDQAVKAGANASVVNFGGATDWQDEIFRTGVSQNYSLSYGGGNQKTLYRFSLGYLDQDGILESTSLKRLNARVNASHKMLNDKVELAVQLTTSRLNNTYAPVTNNAGFEGNIIGAALQANPTRVAYNADGTLNQSFDWRNPVAMYQLIDDTGETTRVLGNISASWHITSGLTYKLNLGMDNASSVRRTGVDPDLYFNDILNRGRAILDNRYLSSRLVEHTLNFNKQMGNNRLDAIAGFSYQEFSNRGHNVIAQFFVTDSISLVDNIDGVNAQANATAFRGNSDRSVEELQSYFGRVNYNIGDRFLLTATVRADGSTKFGANNKYGVFPSLAGAWRLTEESFVPDLFYDLKLRAGWGVTGNQEFPGNASKALFRPNNDGSLSLVALPNPDIQWEETKQINVGVDFGFAGGRLLGSIDYFNKVTENLIFLVELPQPAPGNPRQFTNLDGNVLNTGVELSLDARIVEGKSFSWQSLLNMTFVKNEVRDLPTFVNTGAINGQGLSGAYAQRIASGQPLFAFYMREFGGFDSEGLGIYPNGDALAFVGDPLPDFNFGFTNNFTFGNLDLSIFLNGVFGFEVYNNTANAIFLKGNLRNGRNVSTEVANSAENPNNFGEASTRFLEKGDFVRLQNLSVGYTFNTRNWKGVSSLRLFLTGQNLLLFTGYTGYDPEVNTDKSINGIPSLGIDYTAYPSARTFSVGVNVGFN